MNLTAGNPATGNRKIRNADTVDTKTGCFGLTGALALLIALFVAAGPVHALPDDRDQPIRIESDRAERDGRQGVTIYEGDVKLSQGSLQISAERLTVHTDTDNQVVEVLAEGSPAHFEQQPEADDEPVTAQASRIHYHVADEQLELVTNARLEQGATTMSGNRIDYDMVQEVMKAEGDASTDQPRIEMVIPPRSQRPE